MNIKVGEYYKLYYKKHNLNNMKFQIRAIVDTEIVVILTKKGRYILLDRIWFDMNKDILTMEGKF